MKWFSAFLGFFALTVVAALPTDVDSAGLVKRASTGDTANLGYAAASTTGGSGGTVTTVTTLAALTSAVSGSSKKIVIISGTITGNTVVKVGSNTSVLGAAGSSLNGIGLRVLNESNVIIRNVKISKVLADAGDAIGVQASKNVWLDHLDLSSDRDHDKDYYDGLLDITHGATGVTVSYSKLYNHYKGSLVGHSDNNGSEDTAITVTYAYNIFSNINSRTPSFRFGHGHIYNNYFDSNNDGINTRDEAQLLVQNNVWVNPKKPIYSTDGGYAVATGNDFGGGENTAPTGSFTSPPYSYSLTDTSSVVSYVNSNAGQKLSF
ncbi:polysaccharide lyase family 1 protein [Cylindrobasidium torrendii FP15055 ss-10]|uniref:pectate lyase n=1 Tax=Cylindrobasidium torrendii FP15055 ss-10 TaxID=1314674 RepID=A0A0D7B6X4_9AGAR|nr:polysaccharide lyase family 1 protein [Cylindrobasidium torrendii FP15055 ss-10]